MASTLWLRFGRPKDRAWRRRWWRLGAEAAAGNSRPAMIEWAAELAEAGREDEARLILAKLQAARDLPQ